MTQSTEIPKRKLHVTRPAETSPPGAGDEELEAQLRAFEEEERARLGLGEARQWTDTQMAPRFTAAQRGKTTLLLGGLTMAHDTLIEAGLEGLGYRVVALPPPDNEALRHGKEFGNRGQCNPTYYTVGNLVKHLVELRDKEGLTAAEVVDRYVFVTAGACGPCRFGMYVTEYRKVLRDAGFEGFRVLLFQQTGGFRQATGEEAPGLDMNPAFFVTLVKACVIGDVLNALAYRTRPYEVTPGATDRALDEAKAILRAAFREKRSLFVALWRAGEVMAAVEVDRLRPKPKVSIIGEFWAMTTEGDGNYQLQRFLESEGGEPDVQLVAAWLLYNIWESSRDTKVRTELRAADGTLRGLAELGEIGVAKRLAILRFAELATRAIFQLYAHVGGLYGYKLPDMDEVAEVSDKYYSNDLRGGEGHMEVGKLILNGLHKKAHMTLSVKPFGCMPSASVSDGVQSAVAERFPGSLFCAVETSGDGKVNFYSRIQMVLFKARAMAETELQAALTETGLTLEEVRAYLVDHPRLGRATFKAPHRVAGTAADLVYEVARRRSTPAHVRAAQDAQRLADAAVSWVARATRHLAANRHDVGARLRTDVELVRELVASKGGALVPLFDSLLSRALG